MLWIALLPLLVASPALSGFFKADPLLYLGSLALDLVPGVLKGAPYIDPNSGLTSQALGRLAAWQWLQGTVPWWNHYTGIGLPLAAEYQPAAFFPLTFLLLLPNGMAWQQVVLQILSGWGTFGLLRQMGCGRMAALTGGILYSFNGTLAWFAHAPATPVPFLPWMLWGIERIAISSRDQLPGGWGMLAAAMALSLLSGFPETAYLSGLLALAWTAMRGLQLPIPVRRAYVTRIGLGGAAGIAIAGPQVYAFLEYLQHADIGEHGGRFAHEAMNVLSLPQSLFAPYLYGPIFAYTEGSTDWTMHVWGGIGGYATLALAAAAVAGFWSRRDALGWLLLGWCVVTLLRTFGVPGTSTVWNLIPGVSLAAFYRYAPPSWELAMVLLAARGIDAWSHAERSPRPAVIAAGVAIALGTVMAGLVLATKLWPLIAHVPHSRNWAAGTLLLALGVAIAAAVQIGRGARGARALGALLVVEAIVMFALPSFGNPRGGRIDTHAVQFLRDNLGFHRFFTVGPFQPNYGAYFRLGSINYNYLPNSKLWYKWVKDHLDQQADSVVFNGLRGGDLSAVAELRRNRAAYEEVGVRFVLTSPNNNPFAGGEPARKVFGDAIMDIYELPGAKPYYDSAGGKCVLNAAQRSHVVAECSAPDRVFRRELFFPGWTATVAGREVEIRKHLDLYQSVELPAGRSEVRFDYAPPHIGWAWLASALGLILASAPLLLKRARRWAPRNRSAT